MTINQFARHIAGLVGSEELAFCRQIGMSEVDSLTQSFRVLDECYNFVFEPDRPATLTRFRPMGTK